MITCKQYIYLVIIIITVFISDVKNIALQKRALQKEHEKPQTEKWVDSFFGKSDQHNLQLESLVKLLNVIASHLDNCTLMILYDSSAENIDKFILEKLFKTVPLCYIHGRIELDNEYINHLLDATRDRCLSFMLFLNDVMMAEKIIGKQADTKVVIVSRSSQWRVHEFLESHISQNIVNLLVVMKSDQINRENMILPYILYTHKLYIDGIGSSKPQILMSWFNNKLTKPNSPVFPLKLATGFASHRFIISVTHQPPYVIKRGIDNNDDIQWDGIEIRLIKILSEMLNFTTDFHEATDFDKLGSGDAVINVMRQNKINVGLAGLYATSEKVVEFDLSHGHSADCAAFISLTSTALPRYRAIMGPFQWTVWLALTITYLFAILPLAFSDRLSISHLLTQPQEIENMFWYVFGTFTNCFTFKGKDSWSKSERASTRLFIGWYWVFTIIISACYTGSIIAFVTLPVFPKTTDTIQQLLGGHYQIGTLDKGGWQYWFENATDKKAIKILKNIEYIPTVESGLKNITSAFFWPYSFLGSRDLLDFTVRTNFTTNKRSVMHISSECFAHFTVSMAFPKSSIYTKLFNSIILRAIQSGLIKKIKHDVEWDIMRSSTGKFLQANSIGAIRSPTTDDRALTTQDTQGMFLLLGAGFLMGAACLISEILGGCLKFCKTGKITRSASIITTSRSFLLPTPMLNDQQSEIEFVPDEETNSNSTKVDSEHSFNNTVIVHNTLETLSENEFNDDKSSSLTKSEIDCEINRLFDFDHLFGENSSYHSEESKVISHLSETFGEYINVEINQSVSPENY